MVFLFQVSAPGSSQPNSIKAQNYQAVSIFNDTMFSS